MITVEVRTMFNRKPKADKTKTDSEYALNDKDLNSVNGGMKTVVVKDPKSLPF